MLEDLYNDRILTHAANIPRLERLAAPQGSARKDSRLCGSRVTVDVALDDAGRIAEYGQEVRACALGQAAASILAQHAIGQDLGRLTALRDRMRAMLKEDGPAPEGDFAELAILAPVRSYRARHASVMLPFEAAVAAVEQAQGVKKTDS